MPLRRGDNTAPQRRCDHAGTCTRPSRVSLLKFFASAPASFGRAPSRAIVGHGNRRLC